MPSNRNSQVARRFRSAGLIVGTVMLVGACQQKELFPGMEAPTQQQSNAMGWPAPHYINIEQGDNQDPSVDTMSYPYSSSPWYMQPGYLQG